jgi:uncharacterized Zn-binding protein involved in type VI secretion
MGVLDHLSNVRYARAVERYAQVAGRLNNGRSGVLGLTAVLGRALGHAESTPATGNAAGGNGGPGGGEGGGAGGGGGGGGVLATVGRAVQSAIHFEQMLTAPLSAIPFPAFPALRMWDMDVGLPHAHNHPPNVIPPSPVPIPLPSTGPIIPIPILSGSTTVLINSTPAARCGDMGLGVWCGGFFPMYEIFLGSSSVWIEGARAGRLLVDITKHCTFSSPKPSDPPLGPMVGTTVGSGSPNVLIGGVPFPSLFSLAVAQAFKALFRVGGAVFRRMTARSYVQRLLRSGSLTMGHGPAGWADDMTRDLERIARTRAGRQMLGRIEQSGVNVALRPYGALAHNAQYIPLGANGMRDAATGALGRGGGGIVEHNPALWANHPGGGLHGAPPGSTSDAILFHELNHAAQGAEGRLSTAGPTTHGWNSRWRMFEEYSTVAAENGYRSEQGLPLRTAYTNGLP